MYSDTDSGVMNEEVLYPEERRQSATMSGPLPTVTEIECDMDQHSIVSLAVSPTRSHGLMLEPTTDVNAILEPQSAGMIKDESLFIHQR